MMIEKTSKEVQCEFQEKKVRFIRITTTPNKIVTLSNILVKDQGDDWRVLNPFILRCYPLNKNGALDMPIHFNGRYLLELTGEIPEVSEISLIGSNLLEVYDIEIFESDPEQGERSWIQEVSQGNNTINFRTVESADYVIEAKLYLSNSEHVGELSVARPLVPPGTDSRTTTSFIVNCDDAGSLHWSIKPIKE